MTVNRRTIQRAGFTGLVFLVMITLAQEPTAPKLIQLKAQLIWGTDGEKPKDPKIEELDPAFHAKLAKIFRRKHYFVIDRQMLSFKTHGSSITSMSHNCVIEIKHLGDINYEVKLYGEGRLLQTVRQNLPPGHYLTLAGDVKQSQDETWIVALSIQ